MQNISIISQDSSLEFLTKRIPLISDTSVFSHFQEEKQRFFFKDHGRSFRVDEEKTTAFIGCPDLRELGTWLKKCKPLLTNGVVFYLPDIKIEHYLSTMYSGQPRTSNRLESQIFDFVISNKKIVQGFDENKTIPTVINNKTKEMVVKPILAIDLPYIADVDLSTYAKIILDEYEHYEKFKNFLRIKFLDMKQNETSEFFDSNLAKLSFEIKDKVQELNCDFNMLRTKRAFQVTGACLSAFTAILVAVNKGMFSQMAQLLGASGGLLGLYKIIENINESKKAANSPFYYLWLLSKNIHKVK